MTELYLWELHSYLLILPFSHPDREKIADFDRFEDQTRDLWAEHLREQASRGAQGVFPSDEVHAVFGEFADSTLSADQRSVYLAPGYWSSETAYRELAGEALAAYDSKAKVSV